MAKVSKRKANQQIETPRSLELVAQKLEAEVRLYTELFKEMHELISKASRRMDFADSSHTTLVGILRRAPEVQEWLFYSGVDSLPKFIKFMSGLSPKNVKAVRAIAKSEGYGNL